MSDVDEGPSAQGLVLGGRFLLGELLGVGGSASVYEVRDLRDDTEAAVKILHAHLCADDSAREAFLREAGRVHGLVHPNIVRVRGSGLHDAGGVLQPWIAMDLVRGPSLAEWVSTRGPMGVDDAIRLFDGVLAGLGAAHAAGIVHRDVSPRNIVLTDVAAGEAITPTTARLLDFGLADASGHDTRGAGMLFTGSIQSGDGLVAGNPFYMSPELAQGFPVRAASDLYQAGGCLYFAVTGSPPFPRATGQEAMAAHVNAPPPVPSALAPAARPLDRVVTLAMAKTPVRRFRDADTFRAALVVATRGPASGEPGLAPGAGMLGPAALNEGLAGPAAAGDIPLSEASPDAAEVAPSEAVTAVVAPHAPAAPAEPSVTRVIPQQVETPSLDYLDPVDADLGSVADPSSGGSSSGGIVAVIVFLVVAFLGVGLVWSTTSGSWDTQVVPPTVDSPSAEPSGPTSEAAPTEPAESPVEPPPATPTQTPSQTPVEQVAVPPLWGTLADAQAALGQAGLALGVVERIDSPEQADRVLSQSPAAGTPVAPGSVIDVVVASGSNSVPDVVGLDAATASALVESAGFQVARDPAYASASSLVTRTRPASGEALRVGVTVTLTIATQIVTPTTTPTNTPSPRLGDA